MEFYDSKERLPLNYNEKDYEEIKSITKNIFDNLNYDNLKSFDKNEISFDEKIIKNICFTCSSEIPCMTSLIGGIICQEIIKTTGKFTPINQFKIFDFLQYSTAIPDSYKNYSKREKTRYDDLISIFGTKVVEKIRDLNILLAGAGALGCKLLKNLALFGIFFFEVYFSKIGIIKQIIFPVKMPAKSYSMSISSSSIKNSSTK